MTNLKLVLFSVLSFVFGLFLGGYPREQDFQDETQINLFSKTERSSIEGNAGEIHFSIVQSTSGGANLQSMKALASSDPAADRIVLRAIPEPWFTLPNDASGGSRSAFSDLKMSYLTTVDFSGKKHPIPHGNRNQWEGISSVDTNMWSILQLIVEREPRGDRLLRHQFGIAPNEVFQLIPTKGPKETFRQLADAFKDDKGYVHHYDVGYAHYLHAFRPYSQHLSVLEVGLGCDQVAAIGSSVRLWTKYLPKCRLTMLEFNGACAKKWTSNPQNKDAAPEGGLHMYVGDAGTHDTWRTLLERDGSRTYDFVIDDGGHTMQQQIITFFSLWPSVKRGGIYVVEDLATSYWPEYGGTEAADAHSKATMTNLIGVLTHRLHAMPGGNGMNRDEAFASPFARVDCFHSICFITKR